MDTEPPAWCPSYAEGEELGVVEDPDIKEASGIVESRRTPGVYWVHNDSGDTERFWALSATGATLGTWTIDGKKPRDLEDLALGYGPDGEPDWLYLGDVGDNAESRDEIRILRFEEPIVDPHATEPVVAIVEPDVIELTYPDDVARNSESILIDPLNGDLYVIVKDITGISGVYRVVAPFGGELPIRMEEVASLLFGEAPLYGSALTTGSDASADGRWILIRTYSSLYLWRRDLERPLYTAFEEPPCPVPVASEPQGEAVGFAANGRDYLTVSERSEQPLYVYRRLEAGDTGAP